MWVGVRGAVRDSVQVWLREALPVTEGLPVVVWDGEPDGEAVGAGGLTGTVWVGVAVAVVE